MGFLKRMFGSRSSDQPASSSSRLTESLQALGSREHAEFIVFTLKQRLPYLVALLQGSGVKKPATALGALDLAQIQAEFSQHGFDPDADERQANQAGEVIREAGNAALDMIDSDEGKSIARQMGLDDEGWERRQERIGKVCMSAMEDLVTAGIIFNELMNSSSDLPASPFRAESAAGNTAQVASASTLWSTEGATRAMEASLDIRERILEEQLNWIEARVSQIA